MKPNKSMSKRNKSHFYEYPLIETKEQDILFDKKLSFFFIKLPSVINVTVFHMGMHYAERNLITFKE